MSGPVEREPWLRETLTWLPAVPRAVIHALQMAAEDVPRACGGLTQEEWFLRPGGISSIAFQVRHITGSIQRLLSYAGGRALSPENLEWLDNESAPAGDCGEILQAFHAAVLSAQMIVEQLALGDLEEKREVGRARIPTTVGGLLIHLAEHTSRHVGQVVTTAKLLRAVRAFEARAASGEMERVR